MTSSTHQIARPIALFALPEGRFFGALTQSLAVPNPPVIQMKANVK